MVYATKAKWTHRRDQTGTVIECTGRFARWGDAMGALNHLKRAGRDGVGWVSQDRQVERYSDSTCITLKAKDGDNIPAFLHFAKKHHLLPKWEEEEADIRHTYRLQIDEQKRRGEPAYQIAPDDMAHDLVERAGWVGVDSGPSGRSGGAVFVTNEPRLAFQIAYHLKEEHYLSSTAYDRINQEIKSHMDDPKEEVEFRIAISGEQMARFDKQFPDAGNNRVTLRDDHTAWLRDFSLPFVSHVAPAR